MASLDQLREANVDAQLAPMLLQDVCPTKRTLKAWTSDLIDETRGLMSALLPLTAAELEFLERLNGAGEIAPELLTDDPAMQAVVLGHPGLRWKALNVKEHRR